MIGQSLTRLVLSAARAPRVALGLVVLVVMASLGWIMLSFSMTTDTGALISAHTPWRIDEASVENHFPALKDSILVILDGATPEITQSAADRLATMLETDKTHFVLVRRPDGGQFFAQEGMLFLSRDQVKATLQRLIDAQPLLGPLAADPSLRGMANAISTAADGLAQTDGTGKSKPDQARQFGRVLGALSSAINTSLAGKRAFFSWQSLFAAPGDVPMTRQLLLVQPALHFGDLQPGQNAINALNTDSAQLGLNLKHGLRVQITGAVPLADEEFGTIKDNIGLVALTMLVAMIFCLWIATQSAREIVAILITVMAGLTITLGLGLAVVHRLNVLSIAFVPLFVGLGADFGIQVCVRFNDERSKGGAPMAALEAMAGAIGEPLLMAAAAILLALGAFLPTDYIGIAELGVIAGIGMAVALVLNITMLPALLMLLRPAPPIRPVGIASAARIDHWLARNRRKVLWGFVAAMLVSIALLPKVRFDFNPMHLRDSKGPAMQALTALTRDPQRTPNNILILTPSLAGADQLAARLAKLPQVANAITLDSFIPTDQTAKLALIEDADLLLDPVINPFDMPVSLNDENRVAALDHAATSLDTLVSRKGPTAPAAAALAESFRHLGAAPITSRLTTEKMLSEPLAMTLDHLRSALQAQPISLTSLPPDIAGDWQARDGSALVSVTPAGNSADNHTLKRFSAAVLALAPHATGMPIATQAAASTVAGAFVRAGFIALALVTLLLLLVLRSAKETVFTLAPVVLSGFLTLGSCVLIGQPLNFANIIAFPLLFGVGVAFHIYFVMAWRRGTSNLLQTSLARAVVTSALATGSAFGALWFSHHPGTASMGLILMISLVWTLVCALIFEPALLGPSLQSRATDGTKNP